MTKELAHVSKSTWRRTAMAAVQIAIGVAVVGAAGFALRAWRPRPAPPSGWTITRPPHDVLTLVQVGSEIWAGGPDGLVALDRTTGQWRREIAADGPFEFVASIAEHRGEVWVGHRKGLSHLTGSAWERVASPVLPAGQVWAVVVARDGSTWAGTERGVAELGVRAKLWNKASGLAADAVTVLFEDSRGRIWLGNGLTQEGGLSVIDGGSVRTFSLADGLAHTMVNAIAEDKDGRIWVGEGFGSRGGASRFDGTRWTTWQKRDGLAGEKVRSLLADDAGAIWFGAEYDGAARWDRVGWTYIDTSSGLAGREVKAMVQDSDGDIWFGTEDGVSRRLRGELAPAR